MKVCTVEGCDRQHEARGYCHGHFERLRSGRPIGGPFLDTPAKRFRAKYRVDPSGCWIWTASSDGDGRYGSFRDSESGKFVRAHRWSYEQVRGPIPDGLTLDHLCRTTLCVNPAHLDPVDHRTNVLRGESHQARNARKTECMRGHPFDEDNTYYRPNRGGRVCLTCDGAHKRRKYLRSKYGLVLTVEQILEAGGGVAPSSLELLSMFGSVVPTEVAA